MKQTSDPPLRNNSVPGRARLQPSRDWMRAQAAFRCGCSFKSRLGRSLAVTAVAVLWLGCLGPCSFAAAPASGEAHIVTLRAGVEPEKVCHECKVEAGRTFRHAFRGFAATLDVEQVAAP